MVEWQHVRLSTALGTCRAAALVRSEPRAATAAFSRRVISSKAAAAADFSRRRASSDVATASLKTRIFSSWRLMTSSQGTGACAGENVASENGRPRDSMSNRVRREETST